MIRELLTDSSLYKYSFTADATEIMLLTFLSLTLQSEWSLTARQTANMTACVFAGSLVGTLTFGYLGDHYGRRPAFLLSTAIISVFGVLTALATGYARYDKSKLSSNRTHSRNDATNGTILPPFP
jgi:MFS family permease